MANIALNTVCNRSCSYCFAVNDHEQHKQKEMSLEEFTSTLRWLKGSGMKEVRLLGGEPTLHSRFNEIVELVLDEGMNALIFSGGIIPARAMEVLIAAPANRLSLLINVIRPGEEARLEKIQQQLFAQLGPKIIPGINIPVPGIDLHFILDWFQSYNFQKTVRLGIAHPIYRGNNQFLHPRHYREVGRRVTEFGEAAQARGIHLEFDCGWVPCMFPEGAMSKLNLTPNDVGLRCNPIVDILPGGDAISCFALANLEALSVREFQNVGELRQRFTVLQEPDRPLTLFRECDACAWRARGECSGGCLSGSLRRLRSKNRGVEQVDPPK
jgi:MoaA/NifB/PqqE/SkfB family radical SAM enzyme